MINSFAPASRRSAKPISLPSAYATHTTKNRIQGLDPKRVQALETELSQVEFVPGEVLVKLNTPQALLGDFAAEYSANLIERFQLTEMSPQGDLVRLSLPQGLSMAEALVALRDDERVTYAEVDHIIHLDDAASFTASAAPAEPSPQDTKISPELWNLENKGQYGGTPGADLNVRGAWEVTSGHWETSPLIAVLDTGVDYTHPDLVNNIWKNKGEIPGDGIDNDNNGVVDDLYGYNAYDDTGDPTDGHGHGTHCAGTIAASGHGGQGVVGVALKANIMPIRIFNNNGTGAASSIIRGILYAANNGATVTSNSWVSALENQGIKEAFASSDAIHVAAAGNNNYSTDRRPVYPMGFDLPNVISVGAYDRKDSRSAFSNYGVSTVDVAAPGTDIYSTAPGGGYQVMSGTSMATPHVTGVVSLIKDAYPGISTQAVFDRLHFSSEPVDALSELSKSGGRVDAGRALEADNVPPARPNDFGVMSTASRKVDIAWTATGDDGWRNGNNVAYELYLSDQAITDENLGTLQMVQTGRSTELGSLQQSTLAFKADHNQNRSFFAAMKMVDNVGNRSPLVATEFVVPAAILHFDDSNDSQWTAEGSWQKAQVEGKSVWSSNPVDGEYGNDLDMSLTSVPIDLSAAKETMLSYEAKYELQPGDAVFVEVTKDGGESWKSLRAMSRRSGDWRQAEVDLSAFDGEHVQVRFRLKTDSQDSAFGAMVRDFRVISD